MTGIGLLWALNQISWLPAAWRSNSKPNSFRRRTTSRYRNPDSRPTQAATTIVKSLLYPTGGKLGAPSRSRCASTSRRATSRAISRVSATVLPCATNPGSCSEVAICSATSMSPIVAFAMPALARAGYAMLCSTCAGPSHTAAETRSTGQMSIVGVYRGRAARR